MIRTIRQDAASHAMPVSVTCWPRDTRVSGSSMGFLTWTCCRNCCTSRGTSPSSKPPNLGLDVGRFCRVSSSSWLAASCVSSSASYTPSIRHVGECRWTEAKMGQARIVSAATRPFVAESPSPAAGTCECEVVVALGDDDWGRPRPKAWGPAASSGIRPGESRNDPGVGPGCPRCFTWSSTWPNRSRMAILAGSNL